MGTPRCLLPELVADRERPAAGGAETDGTDVRSKKIISFFGVTVRSPGQQANLLDSQPFGWALIVWCCGKTAVDCVADVQTVHFYSGYVDVLWIERRGDVETARFTLSSTALSPAMTRLGDAPVSLKQDVPVPAPVPGASAVPSQFAPNLPLPTPQPASLSEIHVIRFDQNVVSALAMVSLLQQALVSRLHVAVAAVVGDQAFGFAPMITDVRIIGPGGSFQPHWPEKWTG